MVSVLGAVGLTAAYLVVRSFLPRGHAAFAIGCLALGPVSGTLGVSYMTDVPAFALEALALLSGLRALRTRRFSFPWFVASLLIGVAASGWQVSLPSVKVPSVTTSTWALACDFRVSSALSMLCV
jgi:4-amino-4-deoxy-L-arabinose transferase-like glycosyltransferase